MTRTATLLEFVFLDLLLAVDIEQMEQKQTFRLHLTNRFIYSIEMSTKIMAIKIISSKYLVSFLKSNFPSASRQKNIAYKIHSIVDWYLYGLPSPWKMNQKEKNVDGHSLCCVLYPLFCWHWHSFIRLYFLRCRDINLFNVMIIQYDYKISSANATN